MTELTKTIYICIFNFSFITEVALTKPMAVFSMDVEQKLFDICTHLYFCNISTIY